MQLLHIYDSSMAQATRAQILALQAQLGAASGVDPGDGSSSGLGVWLD